MNFEIISESTEVKTMYVGGRIAIWHGSEKCMEKGDGERNYIGMKRTESAKGNKT